MPLLPLNDGGFLCNKTNKHSLTTFALTLIDWRGCPGLQKPLLKTHFLKNKLIFISTRPEAFLRCSEDLKGFRSFPAPKQQPSCAPASVSQGLEWSQCYKALFHRAGRLESGEHPLWRHAGSSQARRGAGVRHTCIFSNSGQTQMAWLVSRWFFLTLVGIAFEIFHCDTDTARIRRIRLLFLKGPV